MLPMTEMRTNSAWRATCGESQEPVHYPHFNHSFEWIVGSSLKQSRAADGDDSEDVRFSRLCGPRVLEAHSLGRQHCFLEWKLVVDRTWKEKDPVSGFEGQNK